MICFHKYDLYGKPQLVKCKEYWGGWIYWTENMQSKKCKKCGKIKRRKIR